MAKQRTKKIARRNRSAKDAWFAAHKEELKLDLCAYLSERKGQVFTSEAQLMTMLFFCYETDISHSVAAHLMENPPLRALFTFFRDLIEEQEEGKPLYDLVLVARVWAGEVYPRDCPLPVPEDERDQLFKVTWHDRAIFVALPDPGSKH